MEDYLTTFIIFSIAGWMFENLILHKHSTDSLLRSLGYGRIPMLLIYGIGGVVLLIISKLDCSLFAKIIIAAIVINLLECGIGLLSLDYNGRQTWDYSTPTEKICRGYISSRTAIVWTILSAGILVYLPGQL